MTSTKPLPDTDPTPEEELQAQNNILSATVGILCEEVEHFRTRATAAEETVRRLHRTIASGTIGPQDRNASVNALR